MRGSNNDTSTFFIVNPKEYLIEIFHWDGKIERKVIDVNDLETIANLLVMSIDKEIRGFKKNIKEW